MHQRKEGLKTRIVKVFFTFLLSLSLVSCLKSTQLSEQAIVEAIGIDVTQNQYMVTVEYFTPTSSKAESSKTSFIKQKSKSISEAIYEINLKIGKKLYFGQNNIVIIGLEAAKLNTIDILNFFDSEQNTKSSICIAVTENAEKAITHKNDETLIPKSILEKIISESAELGNCCEYRLFKILDISKSNKNSFMLPNLQISENGYFEVVGSYLFEYGKLKITK